MKRSWKWAMWVVTGLAAVLGGYVQFHSGVSEVKSELTALVSKNTPTAVHTATSTVTPTQTPVPHVDLVGPPETLPGFVDWDPVFKAILAQKDHAKTGVLAGVEFHYVPDPGSEEATKRVAATICDDRGAIAVIGYVWSTPAGNALKEYSNCSMPVMLVGATADGLTAANEKAWSQPILQLAPSNIYQAKAIAEALGDTYAANQRPRILLLLDQRANNLGYVTPLAREIKAAVRTYRKAKPIWSPLPYEENTTWADVLSFPGGPFDAIIFVGNFDSARTLLETRKPSASKQIVLVTDGAVNQALLTASALGVWGAFPSAADASYAQIGRDAVDLLEFILTNSTGKTRADVAKQIELLTGLKRPFDIGGRMVQFDYQGRIIRNEGVVSPSDDGAENSDHVDWGLLYHLMRVTPDGSGKLRWIHRESRKPLSAACSTAAQAP